MGKTIIYNNLGILRNSILAREINPNGNLGREVTLEENTTIKVKVFDFYRKGLIVALDNKKEYFMFFNKDLFNIDFFETNEKCPVSAMYIEKFENSEPLSKFLLTAYVSGFIICALFGVIIGLFAVLISTGSV